MPQTKHGRLLAVYDSLPGLLALAHERRQSTADNVYDIQDQLRLEYTARGEPYRYSMPYRHPYHCMVCGQGNTEVQHDLVNPRVEDERSPLRWVQLSESDLHQVRAHGREFPPKVEAFLQHLAGGA